MSDGSVMIVADIFPPVAAVGVYRTVALCRHLAEHGQAVTVITARPWAGEMIDPEMLSLVPKEVRVVATASPDLPLIAARVLKRRRKAGGQAASGTTSEPEQAAGGPSKTRQVVDWLSWWLHLPDSRTGWLVPAVAAGLREARIARPSVVYCTAPGWTSHLVGLALSVLLRVPLVADFQDPWCGSFWHKVPYRAHRFCDEWMEKAVVRRASRITCAWDGIRRHLVARYPSRAADIATILNGFSADETDGVSPVQLDQERCVLLHAGTFYGPRRPEPLFRALRQLKTESPDAARSLLVALLGRPEYAGRPLREIAAEHGVEELVRILPPVARREALALTRGANVALLFGQSGYDALASVPAKTYDYISYGLPVLAIGGGDEVCQIIRDGGCRLWRVNVDDTQGMLTALREIAEVHRNHLLAPTRSEHRLTFAWPASAARLAEILSAAAGYERSR